MLADYVEPELPDDVDEALRDFIERRIREIRRPWSDHDQLCCTVVCGDDLAFDDTGEHLDEGRLRDHIESLIDAGVHGLVLCAGTGEFAFLSDDEKDRIISLGCEIVDGRIPVVAQTSAITTTDAIERTRRAADHGAAAAMVLPPYFEGPFERGVLFHYEKLAKAIDIPIVLYNIPVNSGFDIHPDLYRQLMAMENIDYIKDSTAI